VEQLSKIASRKSSKDSDAGAICPDGELGELTSVLADMDAMIGKLRKNVRILIEEEA
jgi:hypothetical protein